MVPHSLKRYTERMQLRHYTDWQLLRKWALSEVWRTKTENKTSHIIKKGIKTNAREVDVYKNLLRNIETHVPSLIDSFAENEVCILKLEDLETPNLEEAPSKEGYEQAARTLFQIRNKTLDLPRFTLRAAKHIEDLDYILNHTQHRKGEIQNLRSRMVRHIEQLYHHMEPVLTHNDYHTKNLIYRDGSVYVIDWASAYLSPHLGDLYCLIRSVETERERIIQAYEQVSGSRTVRWEVRIGGICWLIESLRNLLDEGIHYIAVAADWIPDLIDELIKESTHLEL